MSRPTRARACAGKLAHTDRTAALAHIARLIRDGAAATAHEPYQCRHCRTPAGGPMWHVGHRRKARR